MWSADDPPLVCDALEILLIGLPLVGAPLSYVGLIHGAKRGLGESPQVALGYLLLAVVCWVATRRARPA